MFKKILIANRGEIALRIMRTCKEMGIATVAVYSDADKKALHVLHADEAVHIGPSEPTQSYLDMEKIITAALETGAEAIHPGYGFLAENALFSERCQEADIVFIGPPPRVIEDLGDKIRARQIMQQGGVPVIPGMTEEASDPAAWGTSAEAIGYPVLIKAAAGGGGKGMRVVDRPEDLNEACQSASREAAAAFGSGAIYMEKFLAKSRHVEVQILADTQGNAIHLLERECSIQRRHQKIIEETPSPALTAELRKEMGRAAVAAAKASGYVNAGTVEFILDPDGKFYFLEVNTRLQVEHPITEMITGIDLVRQQIKVAAGYPLTVSQEEVSGRGHAIECRIYAEDPENNFFPSPGKIIFLQEPSGPGIRNDCGVYSGCEVPMEYDPILSKLVVHGETREQAIRRMVRALESYAILGIKTPISFLIDVLRSKPFEKGETFTDFIQTHFSEWKPGADTYDMAAMAYVADALSPKQQATGGAAASAGHPSPWKTLGGWRQ
ncbi:MAG: acetyl-CoA carboxylase biotin carboxylase subunit [Desulfobacterales bacterium]|nr:acetyl-CoA carboxylase biotin carboxylase subunit [Desulfobacterales bacterium]